MAAMSIATHVAPTIPSTAQLKPLPFSLDLSCPLSLPPRPSAGDLWPYPLAGPSSRPEETTACYIKRRYLETLFLSDLLFPLSHFAQDLAHCSFDATSSTTCAQALAPLLLSLQDVERKHRKTILPVVSAFISASTNPSPDIAASIVEEAFQASGLAAEECDVLKVAMELRQASRTMSEGGVMKARQLCDELEKRETLMQIIMLFQYLSHGPIELLKKRKREKRKSNGPSVLDDPATSLELLVDRLSVWSAVAELGVAEVNSGEENKVQTMLKEFWDDVVKPFILSKQPDICASFHLKVFARPLSPSLQAQKSQNASVPLIPTKKSRKPLMTRARPSSDMLTQPDNIPLHPPIPSRSLSRAPSDLSFRKSPSRDRSLSRSLSARPTESLELKRTSSTSIDQITSSTTDLGQYGSRKTLSRAASGKDLFKGRQVGFIKRSSSVLLKKGKDKESQSLGPGLGRTESQSRMGLLGRKTSDPKARRNSEDSQSRSQAGTLIFATPSKPRGANTIFGPRIGQFAASTPTREEPSSAERPSYVMDTPQTSGRMSKNHELDQPFSIAETPVAPGRTGLHSSGGYYASMAVNALNDEVAGDSGDENDSLADLMVMTDDEDDTVPDTPARR